MVHPDFMEVLLTRIKQLLNLDAKSAVKMCDRAMGWGFTGEEEGKGAFKITALWSDTKTFTNSTFQKPEDSSKSRIWPFQCVGFLTDWCRFNDSTKSRNSLDRRAWRARTWILKSLRMSTHTLDETIDNCSENYNLLLFKLKYIVR